MNASKLFRTRCPFRKTAAAVTLSLSCGLFTSTAHAQFVDYAAIAQRLGEFLQTAIREGRDAADQATQISNQATQISNQIQQYQALISKIMNFSISSLFPQPGAQLSLITDVHAFIKQACPGSQDIVQTVLGALNLNNVLDMNGNIIQQQQRICQNITLLQIDNFNMAVNALDELKKYQDMLKKLDAESNANTNPGSVQAVGTLSAQLQASLLTAMKDKEERFKANNSAIATLQSQQSILANIALKGKASTVGTIVQAGAFAAAFSN